jgi:hypothetical protein
MTVVTRLRDTVRGPAALEPVGAAVRAVERRLSGTYVVDEWGCDAELLAAAGLASNLRWAVSIGGATNVPPFGPALLVANSRRFAATPLLVAFALNRTAGRAVRFVGVPDVAPLGPALRRIGGVVARPDEVAGLLRAGHVVALFCPGSVRQPDRVGLVSPALVVPALDTGAPVLPVAAMSSPLSRKARVEVGPPVARRGVRGPLAAVELAEAAREGVQRLFDEATPPRWMFGG